MSISNGLPTRRAPLHPPTRAVDVHRDPGATRAQARAIDGAARVHRHRQRRATRPRTSRGQSCLRATIGLTDVARRTGIRHASAAISIRSTRDRHVGRRIGARHLEERRLEHTAQEERSPQDRQRDPRRRCAWRTARPSRARSRRVAPSAMRTPNSRVRCATEYAITP